MSRKKVVLNGNSLQKALVPVEEQPYQIPDHWNWVKFEAVISIQSNKADSIKQKEYLTEGNLPVIDQGQDLIGGFTNDMSLKYTGDLPVIVFGDHTRCLKWIDFEFVQGADGTKLLKVEDFVFSKYIYYYLKSIKLPDKGYSRHFKFLRETPIPLPPIDEQKRIADKIERMLDKINQSKQLIEEAKQTFELRRAAILEKAFSGELTRKWREDNYSTVSDLLKQLELYKQKKINFGIPSDLSYKLYDIPNNWKWIRLENLIEFTAYGTSTKTSDEPGVPVIRMGNINEGKILMENFKYLPCDHPDVSKYTLEVNDILFNRTNSYELVGKSAIVNELQAGKMTYASYLVNVRLLMKELLSEYICQYINSHIGRGFLLSMVTQQVGQANINATKLASLMVPLPPISEIKYISDMFRLINEKEKKLKEKLELETVINSITNSVLQSAFRGDLMKS